jgi:hypothetical protein
LIELGTAYGTTDENDRIRCEYGKKTAVYGHRTLAVNTPYIIRHKYGRKTSTWITAK